ncbi:carboxypeptidase-like regulatory domain-containing protein [Flavobacterium sp. AC]|uniref:Carboxypeptidase-like regulatory domain-containing protein n=1 Tax=Flavobacterium azizsancarii TaxID=2961580 RepID=A0ABT4WHH8_9FLAO|nr:carboxypeptidase-like regulatory domain-containing protein [Flavobacterium azizsancarii]MDA6071921.1 carboxypeptidase-like regulatory domain-containing protein [Flavobacterium azizsancarii]
MRRNYMLVFILLSFGVTFAQEEAIFTGTVIDAKTQNLLEIVVVSIQNSSITQLTTVQGKFELHSSIKGEQLLLLHSQSYKDLLLKVNSNSGQTVDLGILQLEDNFSDDVPAILITLLDADLSDYNISSEYCRKSVKIVEKYVVCGKWLRRI